MRRTSLISSRRTRALRDRPAIDTRLLSTPFPTRRWKVHRLYAALRYPRSHPRLRPLNGVLTPGHRLGGRPDTVGSPEAIAPRLDSPVASLGTPLYHGDGKEYTPDPLRRVGSVWGSYPFPDSPVLPLGDSCSPRDGRESVLPSLRMVERLPHTDRPEVPSSLVDLRVWRGLAPQSLRLGHGPSIAYSSQTYKMQTQTPQPDNPFSTVIPSLLPNIELEAEIGASAPTSASVLLSSSPLMALRACPEFLEGERGIKGVRVPPSRTFNNQSRA